MKNALIHDTRILQIVEIGEDFEVAQGLEWVDVEDTTTTDDTFVNDVVVKHSPPIRSLESVIKTITVEMHNVLNDGILWAFNAGDTPHEISLNVGMRETLTTFERLISKGHLNPHRGYLHSNGVKIRKPDGGDLSDSAVDEIAVFAGQWSLAMSDIAVTEKISAATLSQAGLQTYDAKSIDWFIIWDSVEHPDWSNNLVLKNP